MNDSEVARRTGISTARVAPTRRQTDGAQQYFTPDVYERIQKFHEEMVISISKDKKPNAREREFLSWSLREINKESVRQSGILEKVSQNLANRE